MVVKEEETQIKEEVVKRSKSFMDDTVKILHGLDVQLGDIMRFGDMSLNLKWPKVIMLINYHADAKLVNMDMKCSEVLEYIHFL